MSLLILFVLGAIVGSFINVVGLRWNSGIGLGGRSFCPTCHRKLKWTELVPVISFLFQQGKCRGCRSRISWQYPFIEIFTGLLFVSLYSVFINGYLNQESIVAFILTLTVFLIYTAIMIYDWRHKIIPDPLVYASILLAVVLHVYLNNHSAFDWIAGPIVFLFFALIWVVSRGRAMGLGDAKLGLSIGILLGASQGFSAIVMSFWIGTVLTLAFVLFGKIFSNLSLFRSAKGLTMKSEVPFGPFMILGAWASLIFNLDLLHVLSL